MEFGGRVMLQYPKRRPARRNEGIDAGMGRELWEFVESKSGDGLPKALTERKCKSREGRGALNLSSFPPTV